MAELAALQIHRRLAAVTVVIAAIIALAALVPQAAHAEYSTGYHHFCWEVTLGNNAVCNGQAHDGLAGYATEVDGSGYNHSVCVEAEYSGGIRMCSSGPNQGVYNSTPPGTNVSLPLISNNASGSNKVYGAVVFCAATNLGC
jgi:opacity protein-like surface antigen